MAKNIARIARLKKLKTLLEEYEDYFEPIMTGLHLFKLFVGLIFLGHLMACCWCAKLCLTVGPPSPELALIAAAGITWAWKTTYWRMGR